MEEINDDIEFLFDKFREDTLVMLQCEHGMSLEEAEEEFQKFIEDLS